MSQTGLLFYLVVGTVALGCVTIGFMTSPSCGVVAAVGTIMFFACVDILDWQYGTNVEANE